MAKRPGIFPMFFISGFECSTFVWQDKGRRNLVTETQHDRFALFSDPVELQDVIDAAKRLKMKGDKNWS